MMSQAVDFVWMSHENYVVTSAKLAHSVRASRNSQFRNNGVHNLRTPLISGPQVRSLYDPPYFSSAYGVPAQTLFSKKPVIDLFLEIWRVRFPVFQQRGWSILTIREFNQLKTFAFLNLFPSLNCW